MKRFLCFALLLAATISVSAEEVVMKAFKCQKEFHGIEVGGPIKVFVEERTEGNIIVRATESIHSIIELKVDDGLLTISFPKGFEVKKISELIQAEVYIPNNGKLCEFTAVACGVIDVKPQIRAKNIEIEGAAASRIEIADVVADKIAIDAVGATKVNIGAVCTSIEADITGASIVDLTGKATKAEFDIVGASTLNAEEFYCSQLEADIAGASAADLCANMADIDTTGASKATIDCSTQLNVSSTGASTVRYSGKCQINIENNSGASTIKRK